MLATGACVCSAAAVVCVVFDVVSDDDDEDVCVLCGFGITVAVMVLDVSISRDAVPVAFGAVVVLLPIVGEGVVWGACGEDIGGPVCMPPGAALWQSCCGPTPSRKATTRFWPVTPWPPHAWYMAWDMP